MCALAWKGEAGEEVEPIREVEAVRAIRALLAGRPRDLLLFSLGINNSLRAGDLLRLTVNQVRHLEPGQSVLTRDKRTGGESLLVVHPGSHQVLQAHLAALRPPEPPANMYLFASEQGWSPIRTERLDELVRHWTRSVGLAGRYGAHTLRKTFGYLQRTRYGVDLEVLAQRFNHDSPAVTARYLGLTGTRVEPAVWNEL